MAEVRDYIAGRFSAELPSSPWVYADEGKSGIDVGTTPTETNIGGSFGSTIKKVKRILFSIPFGVIRKFSLSNGGVLAKSNTNLFYDLIIVVHNEQMLTKGENKLRRRVFS